MKTSFRKFRDIPVKSVPLSSVINRLVPFNSLADLCSCVVRDAGKLFLLVCARSAVAELVYAFVSPHSSVK